MNCPSDELLARFALGLHDEADLGPHVEQCGDCSSRIEELRLVAARVNELSAKFEHGHEAARKRLIDALSAEAVAVAGVCGPGELEAPASQRPATATVLKPTPSKSRMGVLTMKQRLALGSVGVAAAVALIVMWNAAKPVSAMAQVAEKIRQATSWKATTAYEANQGEAVAGPGISDKAGSTFYWQAPGSVRVDNDGGAGKSGTDIFLRDKPGISLDHADKTFRRLPPRQGQISPLMVLDAVARFSGQADRELGSKQIDGKSARGFRIALAKIDPDAQPGVAEVWVDAQTSLPVLLRYEVEDAGSVMTMTFKDFQWNLRLDPRLFDTTPPADYADKTPKPRSLEVQVASIVEALEVYSELLGGHYPRGKMVYGDVTRDEMYAAIGIKGMPTDKQVRSEGYSKAIRAGLGFATLNAVLRDNSDAAYYGKTVLPKDSDKVLLRWKLDDGRYQAIFGDLKSEVVSTERLRELEGN